MHNNDELMRNSPGQFDENNKGGIDVEVDVLSPCLIDTATGNVVDTSYSGADCKELVGLKQKGWLFDWTHKDLAKSEIYKITLDDDNDIQGLIAVEDYKSVSAVYVNIAESAPHNRGAAKRYEGVGGHLFAVAVKRSIDLGYEGYVFMDAKNTDLVDYYCEKFGAVFIGMPHPYRVAIEEDAAEALMEIYTLQEG